MFLKSIKFALNSRNTIIRNNIKLSDYNLITKNHYPIFSNLRSQRYYTLNSKIDSKGNQNLVDNFVEEHSLNESFFWEWKKEIDNLKKFQHDFESGKTVDTCYRFFKK